MSQRKKSKSPSLKVIEVVYIPAPDSEERLRRVLSILLRQKHQDNEMKEVGSEDNR